MKMTNRKKFWYTLLMIAMVIYLVKVILIDDHTINKYEYDYERTGNTGWVKVKHNDSTWWEEYDYDSINIRNNK